ncbi:hypothetical protein PROSTU_01148 [Providencia stuartii ATCC 25827]|uniref:Uncharacterized protein n=1 Tax=Providencia stuartii ATCC 25827 TaxID=471874 RepID=A0AA87CS07_PROST|nr:hypothetical protein PROSTU_01148 [Providencia stuartii ATCC 25827]
MVLSIDLGSARGRLIVLFMRHCLLFGEQITRLIVSKQRHQIACVYYQKAR